MNSVNVPGIVDHVLVEIIQHGKPSEEVIDSVIESSTSEVHLAILDELGEVDLSEPAPALAAGWYRVRRQLAYNALEVEVRRRLTLVSKRS